MKTEIAAAPRIGALDGLRGLGIIAIIAFNADVLFGGVFGSSGADRVVTRLLGAGWLGLDLFFVLSGFFITTILVEQKEAGGAWRFFSQFYMRRAFRIFPLYYVFLFLYLQFLRFNPIIDSGYPIFPHNEWSFMLFYYNNVAALHDYAIPNLHIYWALCIEVQFYLLWPWLVWGLGPRALEWTCVGLALLALVLRLIVVRWAHGMPIAAIATPCRIDGLALGSLVALLHRDPAQWERVSRYAGGLAVLLALVVVGLGYEQGHFFSGIDFRYNRPQLSHDSRVIQTWGVTAAVAFFSALLVYILAGRSRPASLLGRVLSWGPLRSLGLFSYAMYLFHGVIFHALDYYAAQVLPHYGDYEPGVAKSVAVVILVAASYGVAGVIYFVWDRPFMNMVKRWTA